MPPSATTSSNNASFRLEGGCDDGLIVVLSGDVIAGDVTSPLGSLSQPCSSGLTFSFTVGKGSDGTYVFDLKQAASDGTTSSVVRRTWIRDTLAPNAPVITSPVSNPLTSGGSLLTLAGTCEAGSDLTLSGDDLQSGICTGGGTFSFSISETSDATYVYALSQQDSVENQSTAASFTWIRNSSIPSMPTIVTPASSPYSSGGSTLTVSGTCTSGLEVVIGGDISLSDVTGPVAGSATQSCASSTYSFTVAKSTDRSYAIELHQVNPGNGNSSAHASLVWIRDTQTPGAPTMTAPATNPFSSGDTTLNIVGGCEPGATVTLTGDSSQSATCSGASAYNFSVTKSSDATYMFSLAQTDGAGNTSSTVSLTWVRDTSTPSAPTITTPSSSPVRTNTADLEVSGSCDTGMTVFIGGDIGAADVTDPIAGSASQSCIGSTFSFTVEKPTDGSYSIAVYQVNSVNSNTSSDDVVTWIKDTAAPSTPTVSSPAVNPLVSGDTTITIAGSCEAQATVQLVGDDTQSMICTGGGTFSFNVTKTSDDSYAFTLDQVDLAGNASSPRTVNWTRNTSVPSAPVISSPASSPYRSNSSSLTIAGSCTTGYAVHLSGSISAGDVTSPAGSLTQSCVSSAFSFTVAKSTDNSYDFQAHQENTTNGAVSSNAQITWIRDTLAPSVPTRSSPGSSPFTSGDDSITIGGGCEALAIVDLSGASTVSTTCTAGGTYSFSVSKSSDGTYNFSISQTDRSGNQSATTSFQWIRDTTIPATPTITTPSSSPFSSNLSSLIVSGSCQGTNLVTLSGDVTASEVTGGSLTRTCASNAYSYTISKSSDGSYTFGVMQSNTVPVDSAQATVNWIRDTVAPSIPTITAPASSPYTSSGSLSLLGACESGATIFLVGDDTQNTLCSDDAYEFVIDPSSDGTYDYAVSQTDSAGNSSGTRSQQWIRDAGVPPTPTISTPSMSIYTSSASSLTVSGGCSPGASVILGGNVVAGDVTAPPGSLSTTCSVPGTYSFTIAKSSDATYSFTVKENNGSTDSGIVTQDWIRDTTAPTLTIATQPSNPNLMLTATFAFTSNDVGATIECRLDSGSYTGCTSPSIYSSLANGSHTFYVRGVDSAGNVGTAASYTWSQEAYSTVALYHFDNTDLADSSLYSGGESNTLTNSSSTSTTTRKFGDTARSFSGSSQYAFATDNASQDLVRSTMSIEAWVRFAGLPANGSYMTIFAKSGSGSSNLGWQFRLKRQGSNYRLTFSGSLNGTTSTEVSSTSLSTGCSFGTGTFFHLAATWNLGSVKFFCNGIAMGTGTIGTAGSAMLHQTTAQLRVGADGAGGSFLNGIIDEGRISQSLRWSGGFTTPSTAYTAD